MSTTNIQEKIKKKKETQEPCGCRVFKVKS